MQEEILPLVDEEGNVIGKASRSKCHDGTKLLHPVIHLHVFNNKGELFLQKRSSLKDIQPNRWDSSVGGHIDFGEIPKNAVLREANEEIGLKNIQPIFITKYVIETNVERELTYCFYTVYDGDIKIDEKEVSDGRFWTTQQIEEQLGKNIFTYNFELDFVKFLRGGLSTLNILK